MESEYQRLERIGNRFGLVIRGGFNITAEDTSLKVDEVTEAKSLVLFGNAGSSIWPTFSDSDEFRDGLNDPMNRWSERVGNEIAAEHNGLALFPFGGPPYQPFIKWAKQAESLGNSRLGMLIHPVYGLWHAYRFGVALPLSLSELDQASESESFYEKEQRGVSELCENCAEQPCLSACPVNAFSDDNYDVESCYGFLLENSNSDCRSHTCLARQACPEGRKFNYQKEHARFHMDAFFNSISARYEIKTEIGN